MIERIKLAADNKKRLLMAIRKERNLTRISKMLGLKIVSPINKNK